MTADLFGTAPGGASGPGTVDITAPGAREVRAGEVLDAGAPTATPPVVELAKVSRRFPGPPLVEALRQVDLRVERGDYLSIVGPSGSGKSSLLNILGLLDRPTSGDYLLDGRPVGTAGERERARLRAQRIGFVFQAFHLLPQRTVLDNVVLATLYSGVPRARRTARARTALERVGLGHRLGFLPTTLSGGERQRVAVARALVTEPHLLLADEPTGNLDSASSAQVMSLFDELHAEGVTLAVITHDLAVSARAARRVRLVDGRLEEIA
ncbi:ABC transporter ATP-binding protein [Xylanimonas allomyrinae]|uniref:ABC transporter ATP-binding protein n=1 Tax=Xylanimonas allomyrinae TaxID=2509459 RepID=A0A4P6EP39_9MICO|nr:ABC transporter ATP-binding protein [Xylanimonas allomyrinae]QAY64514.1 ABC transporter ATP-binding protein [Xylanimonas allomyrinae]